MFAVMVNYANCTKSMFAFSVIHIIHRIHLSFPHFLSTAKSLIFLET